MTEGRERGRWMRGRGERVAVAEKEGCGRKPRVLEFQAYLRHRQAPGPTIGSLTRAPFAPPKSLETAKDGSCFPWTIAMFFAACGGWLPRRAWRFPERDKRGGSRGGSCCGGSRRAGWGFSAPRALSVFHNFLLGAKIIHIARCRKLSVGKVRAM